VISALDGGKWSLSHPGRIPPAKAPPLPTECDAKLASNLISTLFRKEKSVIPVAKLTANHRPSRP